MELDSIVTRSSTMQDTHRAEHINEHKAHFIDFAYSST
jgi:hypothetical protein